MLATAALIVAAGRGERAGGGAPKQYQRVAGHPLLSWSARTFEQHREITTVRFVIGADQMPLFEEAIPAAMTRRKPVLGGATRQDSVRNGLESLRELEPDFV